MLLLDMFDNDKDVQAKGKQQKSINKLKKRRADAVGMLLGCCVANSVIATAMIVAMLNKQPFGTPWFLFSKLTNLHPCVCKFFHRTKASLYSYK